MELYATSVYQLILILANQVGKLEEEKFIEGRLHQNFVWIKKFVSLQSQMSLAEAQQNIPQNYSKAAKKLAVQFSTKYADLFKLGEPSDEDEDFYQNEDFTELH
jgi:hypothetical protein